jgi:TolB protein
MAQNRVLLSNLSLRWIILGAAAMLASGCGESPEEPAPPATGRLGIRVSTNAASIDADADGYSVTVNTSPARAISVRGDLTTIDLPVGAYQLRLEGLAPNCSVDGPAELLVDVIADATATAAFSVSCVANTGTVRVTTVSSGPDAATNFYSLNLPGLGTIQLRANDTLTFANVRVGTTSQAVLGGVPANCAVISPSSPKLTVEFAATVELAFVVSCETGGSVEITGNTTGADLDENGYHTQLWRKGSSTPSYVWIPPNGTATVSRLMSGTYELRFADFLANCAATSAPSSVNVVSGTVTHVTLEVSCAAVSRIVFVKGSDSDAEIYVTKTNQSGEGRITEQPGWDGDPGWAPDGRIVFASDRDGNREIYVMNADGSNPVRLTKSAGADYRPVWSRNGAKIAFVSERDGNAEIYTMNSDGTNPVRLTNNGSYDGDPDWSPDGTRIAFRSKRDGSASIYVMNQDGSDPRRLTFTNFEDWQPAWSPTGDRIAFSRGDAGGKRNIFVMSATGADLTQLTYQLTDATDPTWSTDGGEIAFAFLSDDCHSAYYAGYDCVPYLLTYRFGQPGLYYLAGAPSFNPDWRR